MLDISFWNLVFTIINLIVLYLILKKFLIGPVTGIMEKRSKMIEEQMAGARDAEEQANALKAQYEESLKSAKEESRQIVEKARNEAKLEQEKQTALAAAQAQKIVSDARKAAEEEWEKALDGAKSEIADLAVLAAKKMLSGGSEEANRMLYDQFLTGAGEADDTDIH